MDVFLTALNKLVWGPGTLCLILGVGLVLTIRLGFVQLRLFPRAWKQFLGGFRGKGGGTSPFQALCTALAATVGTGNLVGVAGTISLGGPGAVFWMWVSGFLGMATKYAEATLAVRYRVQTPRGYAGGTMYMILKGLGRAFHPLAWAYGLFGLLASFGVGNATQINAMVSGINGVAATLGGRPTGVGNFFLGLLLAVLVGRLLLGGAGAIGNLAEGLVPVFSVGYILLCAGALWTRAGDIPRAFGLIFQGAFSPRAVTGGMLGSSFAALRVGCSRGTFTNEAGMGTAAMAHAGADVESPAQQGLMGIMEVFLDTMVICTLTALVILTSGVSVPYGTDAGVTLPEMAFAAAYGPGAGLFLAVALSCFAFATVLGWGLYGRCCAEFLFGPRAGTGFALAQAAVVVLAACLRAEALWQIAEILNGLMALPNLVALVLLMPESIRLTKEYTALLRRHPQKK